jgi:hypothetical protein
MKYSMWMIGVIGWIVSNGFAATMDIPRERMAAHQNRVQIALIQNGPGQDMPISAEGIVEAKRKAYIDRLTELRGHDSDLDMQKFELNQENFDMQSQLEQNQLILKQVKIDQIAVRRTIKELEREKSQFDKMDRQRKKTGK